MTDLLYEHLTFVAKVLILMIIRNRYFDASHFKFFMFVDWLVRDLFIFLRRSVRAFHEPAIYHVKKKTEYFIFFSVGIFHSTFESVASV